MMGYADGASETAAAARLGVVFPKWERRGRA